MGDASAVDQDVPRARTAAAGDGPPPARPPHLCIAVASSALFDLAESDLVFRAQGRERYRAYQREREAVVLAPGVAFPFVRRLLAVNAVDPRIHPVEVVLISRNDLETGVRVRASIDHHRLDIRRTVFTGGGDPWRYLAAFDACLFLSANLVDVNEAIRLGHAAGTVLPSAFVDDAEPGLRIGFDFDGVLADDESERHNHLHGLASFHAAERAAVATALNPGPLKRLLHELSALQRLELDRERREPDYRRLIRTGIVTARSHPADQRVVTTLRAWGVEVDFAAFVGDLPKDRIIREFRPHLFFDDKPSNAKLAATVAPAVHVPFGIMNVTST